MVYGRYNELVFMGVISWLINQLVTGGPHPVGMLLVIGKTIREIMEVCKKNMAYYRKSLRFLRMLMQFYGDVHGIFTSNKKGILDVFHHVFRAKSSVKPVDVPDMKKNMLFITFPKTVPILDDL